MAEPETALRERWALQMTQLGWRAGDSQIDGIITAYSEPHRRYHGLSHLAHIFDELDRWHTELQTPERCWMAAWYHDIIYDPKGAENEALSAERAARELPRLGAPTALVDDVRRLILPPPTTSRADETAMTRSFSISTFPSWAHRTRSTTPMPSRSARNTAGRPMIFTGKVEPNSSTRRRPASALLSPMNSKRG